MLVWTRFTAPAGLSGSGELETGANGFRLVSFRFPSFVPRATPSTALVTHGGYATTQHFSKCGLSVHCVLGCGETALPAQMLV